MVGFYFFFVLFNFKKNKTMSSLTKKVIKV